MHFVVTSAILDVVALAGFICAAAAFAFAVYGQVQRRRQRERQRVRSGSIVRKDKKRRK
jgi:hypothetical protein